MHRKTFLTQLVGMATMLCMPKGLRALAPKEFTDRGELNGKAELKSIGELQATTELDLAASEALSILSTNDVHSRIEAFAWDADKKLAGKGGFARRATLIDNIRQHAAQVLLHDAGDIFQGTAYFNFYGGELELKLMSEMGYDAATLGNHEFDNGLEALEKQLQHANFPFLCANYDFSNTVLHDKIKSYKIFHKGDFKVGVFGLGVELAHLVSPRLYAETRYLDPIAVARNVVQILQKQGCNLIICLSHLGYDYPEDPHKISDLQLAANTDNIDLIIGGHTHTFLPKPELRTNRQGKSVIISQLGWGGTLLGRLDVRLKGSEKLWAYHNYSLEAARVVAET